MFGSFKLPGLQVYNKASVSRQCCIGIQIDSNREIDTHTHVVAYCQQRHQGNSLEKGLLLPLDARTIEHMLMSEWLHLSALST